MFSNHADVCVGRAGLLLAHRCEPFVLQSPLALLRPLGHSFFPLLQIKPNFCILFHMTPLFDIQLCHARPFSGHVSSEWPFLCDTTQRECAVQAECRSLSATLSCGNVQRDRVPLIIGTVERSPTQVFGICRLLSLPHLHTTSTGTPGSARSLRISPRLPPYQPTTSSVIALTF